MIDDTMRDKWKHKIKVILEADNAGDTRLSQWDKWIIDEMKSKTDKKIDLSFNESKELNRIFHRVG